MQNNKYKIEFKIIYLEKVFTFKDSHKEWMTLMYQKDQLYIQVQLKEI